MIFSFCLFVQLSDSLKFSSITGMNIYRIVQESINNAVKYAEAKTITVSIKKLENALKISVIDDGKGFDLEKLAFGNGLNNMKKRAHEMGSNLIVETKTNEGTTITFEV